MNSTYQIEIIMYITAWCVTMTLIKFIMNLSVKHRKLTMCLVI